MVNETRLKLEFDQIHHFSVFRNALKTFLTSLVVVILEELCSTFMSFHYNNT